jgi:hypothetical protein
VPGKINLFNFGDLGVDIVKSPLHIPDGAWQLAQNAEFCLQGGQGGVKARGGMAKINTIALAGTVQAAAVAPFGYPSTIKLMVGLNTGETNAWDESPDGTSFSGLSPSTLERAAGIDKSPAVLGLGVLSAGQRCASFNNRFYYPGDNYVLYPTVGATAPPYVVWTGSAYSELFRVPDNPTATAGSKPYWISESLQYNNLIYFGVYDPGGVAPDHKGRVLQFDPVNGTLTQIGNRFGQGTGESTKGFPMCLATYLGQLWVGTYGIAGNNQGRVYRINPGFDETWTVDLTATLHNGYYMGLCQYNGKLYAGTDADSSGTAIVQQRTSTGTWSTSLSAPASNVSYFSGLIVYNGLLFCCWYKSAAGSVLIKSFDGTTWSTDLDVAGTYAAKPPGLPFVYRGNLYWPFLGSETSPSNTTGFLLKRTTAGSWSRQLNNVGIRGALGMYVPPT